jgi:hypothetical protein
MVGFARNFVRTSPPNRTQVSSMAKGLTIMAIVIAIFLLLLFTLDLVVGYPFGKASVLMDVAFVICSLGLGYIGWNTWRDLR